MSAFILSDKHISTIAAFVSQNANLPIQELANKLKSINIKSVNHRYSEKTRIIKCKLINPASIYSRNDILNLIKCWDYQSCEDNNIDFHAYKTLVYSLFTNDEINNKNNTSKVWSI